MNYKNIEKSLKRSIDQAPTPDLNTLIEMPFLKMEEHDFITRQEHNPAIHYVNRYSAALSLCFVLLLFFTGGWFYQYRMPSSMISLDVNPSIEIVTNRHDQVLSVNALNQDAQIVLEEQDYRLSELDKAVDSIVTAVIQDGYLNAERNVIMVSVENKNMEKAEVLTTSLKQVIKKSAAAHDMKPNVLRQTLKKDKEAYKEAKKLDVSVGKLKLLEKIEASNETMTATSLADKSMTELLSIAEENKVDLEDTIQFDEEYSEDSLKVSPVPADEKNLDDNDKESSPKDKQDKKDKSKADQSKKDKGKALQKNEKENKDQAGKNSSGQASGKIEDDSKPEKNQKDKNNAGVHNKDHNSYHQHQDKKNKNQSGSKVKSKKDSKEFSGNQGKKDNSKDTKEKK